MVSFISLNSMFKVLVANQDLPLYSEVLHCLIIKCSWSPEYLLNKYLMYKNIFQCPIWMISPCLFSLWIYAPLEFAKPIAGRGAFI